jgi:hypothetical protein
MMVDAKLAHNAVASVVQMYLPIVEELEKAKQMIAALQAKIASDSKLIYDGKAENERLIQLLNEKKANG